MDQPHHDLVGHRGGADGGRDDAASSSTSARFLLGLAEAGFFPGVIVYLTHWFPRAIARARSRSS